MARFKVGDKLVVTKSDWFKKGTHVEVVKIDEDSTIMPYYCSDGNTNLWIGEDSLAHPSKADKNSAFHVGQRVRIRSFEDLAKEFGSEECPHRFPVRGSVIFNENMECLCGRTATIKELPKSGDHIQLENWSDESGNTNWNFLTEMLEPADFEVGQIYRVGKLSAQHRYENAIIRLSGTRPFGFTVKSIRGEAPFDFATNSEYARSLTLLTGPQIGEAIKKYDAGHAEKKAEDSGVKEVKRHAKAGEYIKIVDAEMPGIGETYKNGDIVRVIGDSNERAGAIDVDRKDAPYVNDDEYVVLGPCVCLI